MTPDLLFHMRALTIAVKIWILPFDTGLHTHNVTITHTVKASCFAGKETRHVQLGKRGP